MEFRCRLGTPGGEIVEGVYVADSEARLRREFEEKGLYVLAIQRAGRAALGSPQAPAAQPDLDARVPGLQSGAGDAAQGRHAAGAVARHPPPARREPAAQNRAGRRLRAGSGRGARCRRRSRRTGTLFPGVYTASLLAGEKSGSLEQVIRRYVAYVKVISAVKRKTISALVYPAILLVLSCVVVGIIVLRVVPGVRCVLPAVRRASCRCRRGSSCRSRSSPARTSARGIRASSALAAAVRRLAEDSRATGGGSTSGRCSIPMLGADRAEVRDVAGGADAGDAARRRHSARERDRRVGALDQNQYMAQELQTAAQQVREGRALAPAMTAERRVSRRGDQDGRGRANRPARCRRCSTACRSSTMRKSKRV